MPTRHTLLPVLVVLPWAISCATQEASFVATPDPHAASPSVPEPPLPPGAIARLTPYKPSTQHHGPQIAYLAFTPDGNTLAAIDELGRIGLWDMTTRKETRHVDSQMDDVPTLAISPDGRVITAASNYHKTISTWDLTSGKARLKIEGQSQVWGLAFSPDGRTLASFHRDSRICLWDFNAGAELHGLQLNVGYSSIPAFSADGKRMAARGGGYILVWDVTTGEPVIRISVNDYDRNSGGAVAFSPDGRLLALGDYGREYNLSSFSLWDATSGTEIRRLPGKGSWFMTLRFPPDGTVLAGNSENTHVVLWDTATGRELNRVPTTRGLYSYAFAFSPDGRVLATVMEDAVLLWDVEALKTGTK